MNSCLKYFFVVFNLLFMVGGILFVAFAAWLKYAPLARDLMVVLQSEPVFVYTLMGLGCLMIVVGLCGTCGAIYKKKWMLSVFIGLVVLFLLIEIFVVVYGVINKEKVADHFDDVWTSLHDFTKHQVQRDLKCCGYKNSSEWGNNLPRSCYKGFFKKQQHENSCYDVILDWLVMNVLVVGGGGGVVLLVQIIQIVIASLLIRSVGLKNRVDNEDILTPYGNDGEAKPHVSMSSHENEAYERQPAGIEIESVDHKNNCFET